MIHFQIIQSPDLNIIAPFKYFQNQIYLGRTSGDLWINDRELLSSHIMLEVIHDELLIHPQKNVEFYLINGKRATAVRKIKRNDQITFGQTQMTILDFSQTFYENKKELLDKKLDELIESNSIRLDVIESLTKLMK